MPGQRTKHRCRCKDCRNNKCVCNGRFTIRVGRVPSLEAGLIKCPCCKGENVVSLEKAYRKAEENRAKKNPPCYCNPVPFPHRSGSHRMCLNHPLANVPLTEDEERDWIEILENKKRTTSR